jgi:hypothetical protein
VWVRGGTTNGTETMWVRAFDGHDWSNWDTSSLTTHYDPPVTTINGQTLNKDQWAQLKNWLSYSDINGDAATKYQFWDSGTVADSGYFWMPNDPHHAATQPLTCRLRPSTMDGLRGGTTWF